MEIKKELLDELLKDYRKPEDVIGENVTPPPSVLEPASHRVADFKESVSNVFPPGMVIVAMSQQ
jgi:hypothetical protein